MMEAVLSNADHPEYGVATIPLPIPRNQYDHCVALLEALEIGDASEADCRLDSLDSAWPVLNRLVCTKVNLDELDYLAKRLDSFTVGEFSQFQAMAEKLNLASMKDLINLTFCCQQATVITDFTNLKEIGRDHYMNIHGGCASMEELELLHHLANTFRDNAQPPTNPAGLRIDSKRRQKLMQKRLAMGHKPDDHEENLQTPR